MQRPPSYLLCVEQSPWWGAWLFLFSSQAEWKQLRILPALFKEEKCWSASVPTENPEVAQPQSVPRKLLLCDVLKLSKVCRKGWALKGVKAVEQ